MIALIAAMGTNRAIGRAGALLWRIPGDLPRFRRLTMGHPIVMGRQTYESVGRLLPGRTNIVISRRPAPAAWRAGGDPPRHWTASVDDALRAAAAARGGGEIFVIGGGEIFAQTLARAGRLYLTLVDEAPADADAFFPDYRAFTNVVRRERFAQAVPPHRFVVLERP